LAHKIAEQEEMNMKASVRWLGPVDTDSTSNMSFQANTESGHQVMMDGAPGDVIGGRNLAPRPMEMVLLGTGGCTAYDVVLILRRAREKVSDCVVELNAERAASDPKVFTSIHFHFIVTGEALRVELVERAIKLSHEKYCSASVMLEKTATLTHSFEIREAKAPA
jgi:putative redox protein